MTAEFKLKWIGDINKFLISSLITSAKLEKLVPGSGKEIIAQASKVASTELMLVKMYPIHCKCGSQLKSDDELRFYVTYGFCLLCDQRHTDEMRGAIL